MTKKKVEKTVSEDQHATNAGSIAMKPSNRLAAMNQAVNLIGLMDGGQINNFLDSVKQMQGGTAEDQIPAGTAAKNAAGLKMKPSFAAADVSPLNLGGSVKEAIAEIFGDDQALSDEFKLKTETLFESVLGAQLSVYKAQLEEEAQEAFEAEVTTLNEKFDTYVSHVAEEWLQENQVAIESALTTEITGEFIADLKKLFETHHFNIPEDKVEISQALASRLEEVEAKLNASMEQNITLKDQLVANEKEKVINKVAEGLVVTDKERFRLLIEGIQFGDDYETKLDIVKDKLVTKKPTNKSTNILSEDNSAAEDAATEKKPVSDDMKRYVMATTRIAARK